MKTVTLQFPSVLDLLDFHSVVKANGHYVDPSNLTIKGEFEEADIELAKAGYKAYVIEEG